MPAAERLARINDEWTNSSKFRGWDCSVPFPQCFLTAHQVGGIDAIRPAKARSVAHTIEYQR